MAATMDFTELTNRFADETAAREFLESVRWSSGVICPHCGSKSAYKLTPKADSKRPVREGVYKCKDCRKQFTVTVGTIFEGSKIPLNKWLYAIYMMCSSKKGVSAHQLHRALGITYKSAWFMCQRIRYAMDQSSLFAKFDGTVEVDETYVGGNNKGGKQGHGFDNKTPVVVVLDRDGESRATKMENVTSKNLKDYIRANVDPSATVNTDGSRLYNGLSAEYASHKTVDHKKGEYARGLAHVNNAESWFSLLKRGVIGTFRHVSAKHLDRYAKEFAFRWSYRKTPDYERTIAAIRTVGGKRLMYKQLIK